MLKDVDQQGFNFVSQKKPAEKTTDKWPITKPVKRMTKVNLAEAITEMLLPESLDPSIIEDFYNRIKPMPKDSLRAILGAI